MIGNAEEPPRVGALPVLSCPTCGLGDGHRDLIRHGSILCAGRGRSLLAARLVDRLPRRVALGPGVVRSLAAVARAEVGIGKGRRRRDRQGSYCEDRCKRFAPHATTSLGFAQPSGARPCSSGVAGTQDHASRNLQASRAENPQSAGFYAPGSRVEPRTLTPANPRGPSSPPYPSRSTGEVACSRPWSERSTAATARRRERLGRLPR
jgi:hypothetical protein